MALYQVVYLSMASGEAPTQAELQSLLATSVRNNQALGLTGLLLYAHGGYMQALEGEEAAVRGLFERIRADERHCHVTVLLEGAIEERSFPAWAMAFRRLDEPQAPLPPALAPHFLDGFDAERLHARPGVALDLLCYFSRNNHLLPQPGQVSDPSAAPVAVRAAEAPARVKPSNYPEPFALRMAGRLKRPLGELFGLTNFGVNLTHLAPGAVSALRHAHTKQDELVYVLQGRPTLCTDEGETPLAPGMCAGFKAGTGNAHALRNDTAEEVVYLEIGDRTPGDSASYPDDDLQAVLEEGRWRFLHKDGTPY